MVVVYATGRLAIDKRKYKQVRGSAGWLAAGCSIGGERRRERERDKTHPSLTQLLDSSRFPLVDNG